MNRNLYLFAVFIIIVIPLGFLCYQFYKNEFHAPVDEILALRSLLENTEYQQLHQKLDKYQTNYENGIGSEIDVDNAFSLISTPNPTNKDLFDAWVATMPDAYTAYLARATYYHRLALAKRGKEYIKDTTEEQFAGMREAQVHAREDIDKALELNPKLTIAYSHLISIYSTEGSTQEKFKTLKKALSVDPTSYIIRRDMLYYLLPQWGGSYEAIADFLRDTEQHVTQNPDLAPLMGYLDYAMSWDSYSKKKYNKTIKHATAALEKGEKSYYYKKRAAAYYSLQNYKLAAKDYSSAIRLNKYNSDLYIWRAKSYKNIKQAAKTLKDFEAAVALNSYDYSVRKNYAKELESINRFNEAVDSYKIALYYKPHDEKILFRIASIIMRDLKQYKAAILPLEKLIEINSEEPSYWYEYITALYELHDCEVIGA